MDYPISKQNFSKEGLHIFLNWDSSPVSWKLELSRRAIFVEETPSFFSYDPAFQSRALFNEIDPLCYHAWCAHCYNSLASQLLLQQPRCHRSHSLTEKLLKWQRQADMSCVPPRSSGSTVQCSEEPTYLYHNLESKVVLEFNRPWCIIACCYVAAVLSKCSRSDFFCILDTCILFIVV